MEIDNEGTYTLECDHFVHAEDDRGILVGAPMMCPHCWEFKVAIAYTSPIFTFNEDEAKDLFRD